MFNRSVVMEMHDDVIIPRTSNLTQFSQIFYENYHLISILLLFYLYKFNLVCFE